MLKVQCEACGAPYEVDPRRVPANGMKMRCPACGASVHVAPPDKPAASFDVDLPVKATRPAVPRADPAGLGLPPVSPSASRASAFGLQPDKPAASAAPDFDLPAVKTPAARLSTSAASDLVDLPTPKTSGALGGGVDLPVAKPKPSIPQAATGAFALPAPKLGAVPKLATERAEVERSSDAHAPSFELDLPAAKSSAPRSTKPSSHDELDLLGPGQRESAGHAFGDIDLPTPSTKQHGKPAFGAELPKPSAKAAKPAFGSDIDLPAPSAKAAKPAFGSDIDLPAPSAKAAKPAFGSDIDLPTPRGKAVKPAFGSDIDLPAPSAKAAKPAFGSDIDLPVPSKAQTKPGFGETDLPAPSAKATKPAFGSELDAPLASNESSPSRKSFAKPQNSAHAPLAGARKANADAAPPSALGSMPKDSLAIEPKPFAPGFGSMPKDSLAIEPKPFAPALGAAPADLLALDAKPFAAPASENAASQPRSGPKDLLAFDAEPLANGPAFGTMPKDSLALDPKPFAQAPTVGMFGRLDDVGAAQAPEADALPNVAAAHAPDLVDLPAPNDLPAVKRARPKATTLGLGLRRDELALPSEFGAPANADAQAPESGAFGDSHGNPFALPEQPSAGGLSELDLPAPRDLPVVKKKPAPAATTLGLGAGMLGAARDPLQLLNDPAAVARPRAAAEFALDLPPMSGTVANEERKPARATLSTMDLELDLPPATRRNSDVGDLEPIVLPSAVSNTNTLPLSTLELAPQDLMLTGADGGFGLADTSDRQRLVQSVARRSELDVELKSLSEPSLGASHLASRSTSPSFGELDLGLGGRDSSPGASALGARGTQAEFALQSQAIDAELVPSDEELALRDARRRRASRKRPAWIVPVALAVGIGATGVGLGLFTDHGYFGVYLLEQLLPAAGDPERVRAAIAQAEQKAQSDTYGDVRKALVTLSDARNEAGLNRALLARSLLHEALYQLRFGEDAQSAQRSAAILSRALERGAQTPELTLARAADAARRGELAEAKQLLSSLSDASDPYAELVRGELALLEGKPAAAVGAFQTAEKRGAGARALWGRARAHVASGELELAEQAAKATLAASPRHPAAHTLLAERALARGELAVAQEHVRSAAGYRTIDGVAARPSRAERARAFALEGRIAERRDDPREAQAAYERALATDPLNVDVLLGSGRMLMRLARPQDALSRFDSALSARPSDKPDADGRIPLLEAGSGAVEALLALQRPKEALSRSDTLSAQFPNQPQAKLWHAHVLAALDRWEQAEAAYRETIDKAPELFAGYVGLSQLLFKRNRPEEAARALTLATGRVDDSAEMRRMLGHSELARNHLPEAIHQFEAALRFDGKDAGALFGLVVAQRRSGAMDAAEKTLARLATVDPTFPGLALEQGQIYENRGAYAEAIATYQRALTQRPTDSDLRLRLGAALVVSGQLDEAEVALTQVLKERPNSAEAEHYLGRVLFARKETALAVQRFERAVNLDLLKAEYHMYLAWALLEQGNFGGALASVQKAIARDQNLGDARWLLGRIQLRTGAVRDALVNLQAALRLNPARIEALANMGDAYDQLRDSAQAIKSYQDALKRGPEHGDWWYRLGQLQLDKGRRDEARVALSEAVLRGDRARDRPSWLADAHRLYGDVLRESKRAGEANEHYRLFLELAPLGHPARAEIEQLLYQTRDARR